MAYSKVAVFLVAVASALSAQSHAASVGSASVPAHATLPIVFTETLTAAHAKTGDVFHARTTQAIRLADGREVRSGALVTGHILQANGFHYDKTPYAKQTAGALALQFDTLYVGAIPVPITASLRAIADPFESEKAYEMKSTDLDSLATTTQVGGDLLTPSQSEIVDHNGDVVGYNKKGGAYAHLIGNARSSMTCAAGDTEQPVDRFSASACGLYGFAGQSLIGQDPSVIGLSSTHDSPEIPKHSTALLEFTPQSTNGN